MAARRENSKWIDANERDALIVVNADGTAIGSASSPTTVADGGDVNAGTTTDVAVVTDANGTLSAKLRGLIVLILAMSAKLPATLGQKTAAASLAVVPASAVPYSNGAVTNTKIAVKASAGALSHYHIYNPDASADAYLQIFDAATTGAVTLGVTAPNWSMKIPSGAIMDGPFVDPIAMANGIVIAGTTTYGGSTAPTTALVVNLGYL